MSSPERAGHRHLVVFHHSRPGDVETEQDEEGRGFHALSEVAVLELLTHSVSVFTPALARYSLQPHMWSRDQSDSAQMFTSYLDSSHWAPTHCDIPQDNMRKYLTQPNVYSTLNYSSFWNIFTLTMASIKGSASRKVRTDQPRKSPRYPPTSPIRSLRS